jgi:hypothetical protein
MAKITRFDKVTEIYKIAVDKNLNKSTLVFLLARMSDKGVTKFLTKLKQNYGKSN